MIYMIKLHNQRVCTLSSILQIKCFIHNINNIIKTVFECDSLKLFSDWLSRINHTDCNVVKVSKRLEVMYVLDSTLFNKW